MLDVELELFPSQLAQHMLEHGDIEAVLAAEIMIDHPRVDAGFAADRQYPRPAIALLGKLGDRDAQDALARPLRRWCCLLQHRANVRLRLELHIATYSRIVFHYKHRPPEGPPACLACLSAPAVRPASPQSPIGFDGPFPCVI